MLKILNEGFDKKYKDSSVSKKNKKKIVEAIERPEEFAEFDDDMNPSNYGIEEDLFDVLDTTAKGISDNINTITGEDSVLRDKNLGKNLTDISDTVAEIKTGGMFKEDIEDNLGVFHNDNGNDYKIIERSESGKNALLQRGNQWVIAWNCPESNEGSWGQGHYFFDEDEARKVWEDKYLNESLNESDFSNSFNLKDYIKDYIKYISPKDYQLDEIPSNMTFADILANMHSGRNYLIKSGIDSVVVNQVLNELERIIGTDAFNKAYTTWRNSDVNESLKEDLASYIQKIHDTDEYLWNLHNTDYSWLYDECAKYSDTWGSEDSKDSIADCIRKMPKEKQYEILDKLVAPYNESLTEGVMTGYWCPACHDKSLQSTLMVVDDKRQDGAEVLECDNCGKRFFRSKKDNKIKPLPEYVKVKRFDEAFDVDDKKAKLEVIKRNNYMRIIKEDYNQKLRESIRKIVFRLTEAEMSDEDKRDTEILRNIYKKIDGRKIGKNTFTSEEQEVIDKYGLDVWGYRGDSKVVTNAGRNNVVNSSEYKNSWGRPQQKFDKINYADRARKIDDRDYAHQIIRRKSWDQTFDDAEKEMQSQKQSNRINQMKRALHDRKYYQNEIDNAENDLTNRLNRAEADADKKIADANKRMRDETSWAKKSRDTAQKSINDILDKYRVKECLDRLQEAISPEDKRDSDIIRNIYYKLSNRKNAKLTPEEEEVVAKYGLVKGPYGDSKVYSSGHKPLFKNSDAPNSWGPVNHKLNYADRARKLDNRDYAQDINNMSSWGSGRTFKDKERTRINNELGKDVQDMKGALFDRRYNNERIANAEKDYQNKVAKIEAEKELAKERAKKYSSDNLERSRQKVADANTNIKKLLNKEESLKEAAEDKRVIKTGLSGVKNEEILDSVIGQMSDGIWENSPGMEGYWIPVSIDDCDILVDNNQISKYRYGAKYVDNKYYRKSDDEVRRFFANKIKQITQEYLNDNNLNPYSDWRPDNDEVCDYLDRGSGVTVGDAYKAYKALK